MKLLALSLATIATIFRYFVLCVRILRLPFPQERSNVSLATMYNVLDSARKEIRILDLEPGQASSQIRCNIRHISLLSRPVTAYEAVSYVWGDPNASFEIYCNGSQIRVPRNTEIVLRGLRHMDMRRTIWIDAICIDQLDRMEREQQVAMMTQKTFEPT